jgi:hypothetical protein
VLDLGGGCAIIVSSDEREVQNMSYTEVVVQLVDGTEIKHEFVRDSAYMAFIRSIRRQYKIVEETASARQIIIVEEK